MSQSAVQFAQPGSVRLTVAQAKPNAKATVWKYVWFDKQNNGDKHTMSEGCNCTCIYCGRYFPSSNNVKLESHFCRAADPSNKAVEECPSVPAEVVSALLSELSAAQMSKRMKTEAAAAAAAQQEQLDKQRQASSGSIKNMFAAGRLANVHRCWGRALLSAGLAFETVHNPEFMQAVSSTAELGHTYKLPSADALLSSGLETIAAEYRKEVDEYREKVLCGAQQLFATCLTSDGWCSSQHRPLVNFLLVCCGKALLLNTTDTSGHEKTADYLAQLAQRAVNEAKIDSRRIIAIICDGANRAMMNSFAALEEFKHVQPIWCLCHVLNLLLGDFSKHIHWIRDTDSLARRLVKLLTGSTHIRSMYRDQALKWAGEQADRKPLELTLPCITRFMSLYLMLERLHTMAEVVRRVLVSSDLLDHLHNGKDKNDASEIIDVCCSPTSRFWQRVAKLTKLVEPIYKLLRVADSDEPQICNVMPGLCEIRAHVSNYEAWGGSANAASHLTPLVEARIEDALSPLHRAAHLLDYRNIGKLDHGADPANMQALVACLSKLLPAAKVAPAVNEFESFRTMRGQFASDKFFWKMKPLPYMFWVSYGGAAVHLRDPAILITSCAVSASACERTWSAFSYVVDQRRGHMNQSKQNECVFCYQWIRFKRPRQLSQQEQQDSNELNCEEIEDPMPDAALLNGETE